ncbi:cellulose binding domain-containing protein [Paractinoplanes rhizophilus]|uniref:Cellulose binding domain-containing protein n=1 Tax=Paractinoplanes rhizophilus TaxID=1416877 RepID=A0ABW2I2F6_9ACTN
MSRPRLWLAATLLAATLLAAPATAALAAPTPTDLQATAVTPVSVTLSWTASPGATGYQITYYQAFNDVIWSQTVGNVTTATVTGYILPTRQYSFRVSALDDGGYSPSSNTVTVVTPASTTGDTTPPATPANFRLIVVNPTGPSLGWDPATDNVGVTAYDVYHFDGWYTSTLLGSTTGTAITVPFGTSSTGMHNYYVRARDAAGNVSIASTIVRVPPPTTTTPPPPTLCTVAYKTTSEWNGGFVAEVKITNLSATAIEGWTLVLTFGGDQAVAQAWNATFTQSGTTVVLTGESWNRTIPAGGGTVSAGLLGSWRTSNAAPTSAVLNGTACTLA